MSVKSTYRVFLTGFGRIRNALPAFITGTSDRSTTVTLIVSALEHELLSVTFSQQVWSPTPASEPDITMDELSEPLLHKKV